jgi:hypothetical protein
MLAIIDPHPPSAPASIRSAGMRHRNLAAKIVRDRILVMIRV